LLEARKGVADLLNVDVETCVLISNATTGVNLVLRNLVYHPVDVIVFGSAIYGACEKTITSIAETNPNVQARRVAYELPCESEDIVNDFIKTFEDLRKAGLNPRVAVFDTVSSMPALRFPFERLVEVCKQNNVLSCIDGAHGIGQIPLDLRAVDPDFFVSNCHK
jgi:selenocysteine lyase/cysteine desulfurase